MKKKRDATVEAMYKNVFGKPMPKNYIRFTRDLTVGGLEGALTGKKKRSRRKKNA
jgi:hypothetical protein